jgi:hypothetical protein
MGVLFQGDDSGTYIASMMTEILRGKATEANADV